MDTPELDARPRKVSPWMKLSMKIAAANEEILRLCPSADWENVRAIAEIQICVWIFQTGLFALIGHRLALADHLRPNIVVVAAFLATMITAIDSYVIMRSGWHIEGLKALARGGLDISGGALARVKASFFLAVRVALSVGLAQLSAIFVSTLVYATDINSRIQEAYMQANAHLVGPATVLVDAAIKRATDAFNAQTKRVDGLGAQIALLRQVEIDGAAMDPQIITAEKEVSDLTARKENADDAIIAAENFRDNEMGGFKGDPLNSGREGLGLRYRAAAQKVNTVKNNATSIGRQLNAARKRLEALRAQMPADDSAVRQRAHEQRQAFERALTPENEKLAKLKAELESLTAGREGAIRRAIEAAPDHVDYDNGFLAQITVLEHIAEQDRRIAAVILLIDVICFGFELAAVLAKITSFVPTTYAAILARDAYMKSVEIVDGMMDELKRHERDEATDPPHIPIVSPRDAGGPAEATAPHPFQGTSETTPAPEPLKRKRGRPRKHPLPSALKSPNGQGNSEAA